MSTLRKITLPVPGFGFKAFLIALAGLWLLGLALNYLAQTAELLAAPGWVTLGLQTVSWLPGVALTLLVGFRLWGWLVKLGNFTASEDKRRYAYVLTPKGISERAALTTRFLVRKMAEYHALRAEIEDVSGDMSDEELAELAASAEKK